HRDRAVHGADDVQPDDDDHGAGLRAPGGGQAVAGLAGPARRVAATTPGRGARPPRQGIAGADKDVSPLRRVAGGWWLRRVVGDWWLVEEVALLSSTNH